MVFRGDEYPSTIPLNGTLQIQLYVILKAQVALVDTF